MNNKIPLHVGVIPDGNRRWAKKRKLQIWKGHEKAAEAENLICLIEGAKKLGVKYITFWGFSTENWKRDKKEVEKLFELMEKVILALEDYAHKNKIRFRHFGRKDRIPKRLVSKINQIEKETKNYSEFNVNICFDYGGRDEIVRAVNKLLKEKKKKISVGNFENYLDSKGVPDLDLIIRTSGEQRLSGFLPFQAIYAELLFVKKHFPDFNAKDLRKAVLEFRKRKRRFGGC